MENNQSQLKSLTTEQKTGIVLLFIFAVLTIVLGFLQMRNTIYNPFVVRLDKTNSLQFFLDDNVRLQQADTDKDGLSDYNELNFHNTSPYLPDTDSDQLGDKMEIDQGTDPLCPEGTTCGEIEMSPNQDETKVQTEVAADVNNFDFLGAVGNSLEAVGADASSTAVVSGVSETDMNAVLNNPELLRQLLLSTGKISAEQLAQINDAALLEMVKKINFSAPTN